MTARAAGVLAGRRVAVTRPAGQSAPLLDLLRARGAEPLACPTIAVEPPPSFAPLDAALQRLDQYHWAVFTSANAVASFAERVAVRSVSVPAALRLAAVGGATAEVLSERVRRPDFVPGAASGEALATEIADVTGRRVLFPRGDLAADTLARTLRSRGATVDEVTVYRTVEGAGARELARLVRDGAVDAILFMSASSVRHLVRALGAPTTVGPRLPAVICIGPETARAAGEVGVVVSAVAHDQSAAGLVDALERWFGRNGDVERG